MQPLRVYLSIWERLGLYAYGIFIFGLSLYLAIKWDHLLFGLMFPSVFAKMVAIFFRTRPLEMSDETIRYATALRFCEMRWDEVRRIEVKDRVVLCGEKKRLALPSMQKHERRGQSASGRTLSPANRAARNPSREKGPFRRPALAGLGG